ncbi:MAG: hypothetical protein AAF253_05700 [Pseudomonadota bacterium]
MDNLIWWILPAISGVAGLMLIFAGFAKMFGFKPLSGVARLFFGAGFMGLAGVVALAGLNLQTYKRLTYERPVAQITFNATETPNVYTASIILEGDEGPLTGEDFALLQQVEGDEWTLGARVIKFKPLSNMLGYDSVYKLDRFTVGFEQDVGVDVRKSIIPLSDEPGLNVRELAKEQGGRFGLYDASYGSAVYNPMGDGLAYDIYMTQDALIARSANAATRARVGEPANPIAAPRATGSE